MLKTVLRACLLAPLWAAAEEDPSLACNKALVERPAYSALAQKLPITSMMDVPFEMLADDSKPNNQQRKAISGWATEHRECMRAGEDFRNTHYSPTLAAIVTEADGRAMVVAADLFNRKLSFGEANRRIQAIGDDVRARIAVLTQAAVDQQAADRQKADEAQAAAARQDAAFVRQQALEAQRRREAQANLEAQLDLALRQAAAQTVLNNMYRPAPLVPYVMPKNPVVNTTCSSIGGQTSCTSR